MPSWRARIMATARLMRRVAGRPLDTGEVIDFMTAFEVPHDLEREVSSVLHAEEPE